MKNNSQPNPRFKVGDTFTYLEHGDPRLPVMGKYVYGGNTPKIRKQTISHYGNFTASYNCYELYVSCGKSGWFCMLECECEEWFAKENKSVKVELSLI